jgi:GTPase SAR1 family protein
LSYHFTKNVNISFSEDSIVNPPLQIIKQGREAILSYFSERSKQQFKNTEIKLILLGNSTAGKSSLSRYLREKTYNSAQPSTHGIQTLQWQVPGHEIQVNIWDFGGQEYYHATHRLFLSQNAVYVLVWDSRTNQGGVESTEIYYENDPNPYTIQLEHFPLAWWINSIRHFTRESQPPVPILLVQNKCARDDIQRVSGEFEKAPFALHPAWLDNHIDIESATTYLEKPQPHLKKWQRRFEEFEEKLLDKLQSQLTHYEFAIYHRDIRDRIRALASGQNPVNEMPWEEFSVMCQDIEPEAKMDLVQIYLRDITGDILYFGKNERLQHRVFIRPDWVCNRIYSILSRKVLECEGLFDLDWVCEALQCGRQEALDFVELMCEFELIFPDKDEFGKPNGHYIAPQYLPETCKKGEYLQGLKDDQILTHAFTLWFPDFLPKSHMARFISNWGEQAEGRIFWKNGLLFKTNGLKVLVERNAELKIRVDIQASDIAKREQAMQQVFQSFLDLEDGQFGFAVSLNESNFVWWRDVHEAMMMQARQVKVFPEHHSLLIDLQPFKIFSKPVMATKKVFISYSKSDKEYLTMLKKQLKIYERQNLIAIWDDSKILPGENWDNVIKRELNTADIIILLVSSDLIATDYVWDIEMKAAMDRHQNGTAVVVPIIVRPCVWTSAPFGILNALPEKGVPISSWQNSDEAWSQVVKRIGEILQ